MSLALLDDLDRACPDIAVHVTGLAEIDRVDADLFLTCDSRLVLAAGLVRFTQSGADMLTCGGRTVAVRRGAGTPGGAREALPGETLDLTRPAAAAREILRGTAKASDGVVSRLFNRPVSQRISGLLLHIPGIRPGHLTAVTALFGLLMFAAFLFEGYAGLALGGVLFHVASVVDGVDGEIARATFRDTRAGAVLDTAVDMATNLLFYLGVTIALTRLYGPDQALAGGWCVILGLFGLFLIRRLAARAGEPGSFDIVKIYYRRRYTHGIPKRITDFLVAVTSRDFFAFGNALIILAGGGAAVTYLLAGFATVWVGYILLAAPAILREAEAETAAPLGLSPAE